MPTRLHTSTFTRSARIRILQPLTRHKMQPRIGTSPNFRRQRHKKKNLGLPPDSLPCPTSHARHFNSACAIKCMPRRAHAGITMLPHMLRRLVSSLSRVCASHLCSGGLDLGSHGCCAACSISSVVIGWNPAASSKRLNQGLWA